MAVEVVLEGFPQVFRHGFELLDLKVTLGQNDNSSTCEVFIADPTGTIGASLIQNTLESGGIRELPRATVPTTPSELPSGLTKGTADLSMSPRRRAFLDVIAFAEGADYNVMFTGKTFQGFSDHPKQLQCSGSLCSDAAGRYQFLSTTWLDIKNSNGLKDFSPPEQDKGAIALIKNRGALGDVDSGAFEAAITKCNLEWASLPGSPYGQPTKTMAELRVVYDKALAKYQSGNISPVEKPGAVESQVASSESQEFKGAKIVVTWGSRTFEFFHQGTEVSNRGVLLLRGTGIRWILNRRKRQRSHTQITFRQLAEQIAKANKLTLDWKADKDYEYSYVDQTNLTDYQLLLREAKALGLFVSDQDGKLTIKSLRQIQDTLLVLAPGLNLVSWDIKDEALDPDKEDKGSSLQQSETKADIDPLTGQFTAKKPEVDTSTDNSVTGKAQEDVKGQLAPGQDAIANQEASRVKRVKGLPSVFVLPIHEATLDLTPLSAVRTQNLPGTLNRIWMVDKVTHELKSGKTILNCYSPIEVTVLETASENPTASMVPTAPTGAYIFPVSGFPVTSLRGMRTHPVTGAQRMHHGYDVSMPVGTPIKAMNDGQVLFTDFDAGGYGYFMDIKHPDGKITRYAHLSEFRVLNNATVKRGQVIALSGNTGSSTGPHLHFEVRDSNSSLPLSSVGLRELVNGQNI